MRRGGNGGFTYGPKGMAGIPLIHGGMVSLPCAHCAATVTRRAAHVSRGLTFCNREHRKLYHAAQREARA